MAVCGLMLVTGLFFAARHHFVSMDYGMRNSRLRKQVEELEAEKRRLLLAREVSLSPGEIKKAAKKTGLTDPSATAVVAQVSTSTREKAAPPVKPEDKSLVIRTASVSASMAKVDKAVDKGDKPAKIDNAVAKADKGPKAVKGTSN